MTFICYHLCACILYAIIDLLTKKSFASYSFCKWLIFSSFQQNLPRTIFGFLLLFLQFRVSDFSIHFSPLLGTEFYSFNLIWKYWQSLIISTFNNNRLLSLKERKWWRKLQYRQHWRCTLFLCQTIDESERALVNSWEILFQFRWWCFGEIFAR